MLTLLQICFTIGNEIASKFLIYENLTISAKTGALRLRHGVLPCLCVAIPTVEAVSRVSLCCAESSRVREAVLRWRRRHFFLLNSF